MINEQEKARELAVLLNAFADEKQFEWWNASEKNNGWTNYEVYFVSDLVENFNNYEKIRTKPEAKCVALTQQDLVDRELSRKTMRVDCKYCNRLIVDFDINGVVFLDESVSYEELMSSKFLDDTPCYKEEEVIV